MSLHTKDYYQKLDIQIKVNSKISYDVIYKEYSKYSDCLDYINDIYEGHGDVISTYDDLKISTHSSTHKDIAKIYCSDFRLIYDIYGLLGENYVTS